MQEYIIFSYFMDAIFLYSSLLPSFCLKDFNYSIIFLFFMLFLKAEYEGISHLARKDKMVHNY